ncbi:MAG TPA: VWA domain-containing protein [Candidatus Acidoferrales bacterium]|nr:VWA domain-containing protein [Candidatus Acidoferrales bacterium]
MKNLQKYTTIPQTITARSACAAAILAGLAILAAPQIWMHGTGIAWAASRAAAASRNAVPQIPVQIPVKKPKGEGQNQQLPQTGTTRIQVKLVRLYVTVRDKHGAIIQGLGQNDFHVYEDGVEQKIAFFSKDMTDPITLAMMIDTSGSQQNLLEAEKQTADRFVRDILKKGDLAMAVSFDAEVHMLADFTDDQELLQQAFEKAEIFVPTGLGPTNQPTPSTVLYDAIYRVCNEKMPEEAGRKALIILTDAEDEGSTETEKDAILAAQNANAVVHFLLIAERAAYFLSGQMYTGGAVAHEMANQTGGRVISIRNDNDLDKAFGEISQELRSQYIVAYYPSNTKADGTFRKIKVETTDKNLRTLTRAGYYAPSSANE